MHSLIKKSIFLLLCFFAISILTFQFSTSQAVSSPHALLLEVDGAIGPATADHLSRGLKIAATQNSEVVIIRIDTPGGLDKSMRVIIKDIIGSPIPVVTYVAPSGARAASAGTFILYASHVAAMAPATNLGAASPVSIGALPTPTQKDKGDEAKKVAESVMGKKISNDAIAYIRGLAQMRGRNVEWAEKAVREAASIPAEEALKLNVIDYIAKDIPDLLNQINEKTVTVFNEARSLKTEGLIVETFHPDWRTRLLSVITDPSVAYILLLIGIYGLFFEFANPGFVLPGVVGAIALLLALYAFQLLPINYAGLALIILGIIFMVAEAFVPSFGALGIGGVIAFIAGSVLLLDTGTPGYDIAWQLIFAMSLVNAAFFFIVVGMMVKSRRRPVVSGREGVLGSFGIVVEDFDSLGHVRVHGEMWQAKTETPLTKGQKVKVTMLEGLIIYVEAIGE